MIDCERAFLDSVFLIYHLEKHPAFSPITTSILADIDSGGGELCTSVVSIMEFSVEPYRNNNVQLLNDLSSFFLQYQILPSEVTVEIARNASKLRARYSFLRGLDALQIGAALAEKCDAFITNDSKLKAIEEIRVILIGELAATQW